MTTIQCPWCSVYVKEGPHVCQKRGGREYTRRELEAFRRTPVREVLDELAQIQPEGDPALSDHPFWKRFFED